MTQSPYWSRFQRRLTRRRFLAAAAVTGAGLAVTYACGSDSQPASRQPSPLGPPTPGGALRSALFFDPDNLDPAEGGFAFPVFQRIYSYLFHIHGETLDFIPDLATSLEQPDELTYIFHLRRDARFHNIAPVNGRALKAQDVLYTLNRMRLALNGIDPGFMNRVAESVTAPDDYTVILKNKRPYSSTLQLLGGFWYAIVPEEAAKEFGGLRDTAIGSGPFMLERFEQEGGATLVRNADYYGAPLPHLDRIEIGVITDTTNLLTQFRTGNLDVNTAPLDSPRFQALKRDLDGVQASSNPGILDPWIGLNPRRRYFADKRVREAFDLAIDRRDMIARIAFGEGKLNGPIPWGNQLWALPQDELEKAYVTDIGRAKQLIEASGFTDLKIKHVVTTALPYGREVAQVMKQQLKRIGVEVTIEVLEQNAFIEAVFLQQKFDTCGFDWFPVLDPTVSLRFVDSEDIFGRIFEFYDPDIARLYDRMQAVFDYEERREAMWDLQRAVLKLHGPVLHLFDSYQYNLWWPWVRNWRPENIELNGYNNEIALDARA